MFLKFLRIGFKFFLWLFADVKITGMGNVPPAGTAAIVVTNHLGRMDAMLGVVLAERDDFILMIAEKYQHIWYWRFVAERIDALWLNRFEADLATLREVQRRLKRGDILGMAPEGTRSETETMQQGKPGAIYLASRTQVPIIPIGLMGTEDRVVMSRLKRLKRVHIKAHIGEPYMLPPMDRKNRDAFMEAQTEEMMCRIAALVEPKYRGVYADHPRLHQLLAEQDRGDDDRGATAVGNELGLA